MFGVHTVSAFQTASILFRGHLNNLIIVHSYSISYLRIRPDIVAMKDGKICFIEVKNNTDD